MLREWLTPYNPFNSWKVLTWAENIRGIIDDQFLPPVVVNWDLVLGCNYNCPHCIWAKRRRLPKTKVPEEFILKVPKFLHDWGVKGVCVAGESGDPSLHPQLDVALRLLHHWNIEVGLVSNGYALSEKAIMAAAHYTKFTGFSVDAGTPESYAKVHGLKGKQYFQTVCNHIERLARYAYIYNLPVQVGYKFLILPDSYQTIVEGAKIARNIGVRDFQIRPAELPETEIQKINIPVLEEQLKRVHELETDTFHVYSIRHKFTDTLHKKKQEHCWATPLTSTWLATGDVVCCVDLRDEDYNTLCNYIQEGLPQVRRLWGGEKHLELIREINRRLDNCKRCTNGGYNEIIQNAFVEDKMDVRMI